MTALLELRDKLKEIYAKNDMFIKPLIRFLTAFLALAVINGELGYMSRIDNIAIVLIVALMCSFLPTGCIILFSALFTLLHMYAVSLEVALFGLVVYLLMFLLFFRFSPRDSLVVVLTPLLCFLKIPYVMPITMGLIGGPASAVSVGCGVVVYYLLLGIKNSVPAIGAMNAADATAKLRLIVDALLDNKAMVVMVIAFAITVIVVYMVRRMSIDYSWTIAMVAGVILDMVILLVGDLVYETNISVPGTILGSIVALAIAKVIEFFRFCVDHSRTERVQFEDDEYYYYVKAVPKMTVSAPTKTVKKINTQRVASGTSGRNTGNGRSAGNGRSTGNGRSNGNGAKGTSSDNARRKITITDLDDEFEDDEELF